MKKAIVAFTLLLPMFSQANETDVIYDRDDRVEAREYGDSLY